MGQMNGKEREKFVRELIESEWAFNPSLRRSREEVISKIVEKWEDEISLAYDDGVDQGYLAGTE